MTRLYVDSSVFVEILFGQEGATHYYKLIEKCDEAVSSYLLEAEAYAACAREKADFAKADDLFKSFSLVFPERSLRKEYRMVFDHGCCRGADAHHVAMALHLDPLCQALAFLTADRSQREVARKVGFKTA